MKILIVDDSPPMRSMIRQFLPIASLEVRECDDGIDALPVYADFLPDFVLMDWQMKQMDGLTAINQIVANFSEARIVLITQYNDRELCAAALKAGARGFVLKDNLSELRRLLACQV